MQKQEDLGGIGVAFRKGEQVEIVVADVEILSKAVVGGPKISSQLSPKTMPLPVVKTYVYALV